MSKAGLLVRLEELQERDGYLSRESLEEIADSLGLPLSEVYGVASFYSFLSVRPQGRNIIRVCRSLPCYLKHSEGIINSIHQALGICPGGMTPDGRFSLKLTNCIGACDRAPAMMVNYDVHGDLTPEKIARILQEYY